MTSTNQERIAHADSYYAASANPSPERPELRGNQSADVCVVGAGFSGICTALSLAERGYNVTVIEAARVGWGASGRNGGQIVNSFNRDLDVIEKRYGQDIAAAMGEMAFEGGRIIREHIGQYSIDCDLRDGNVFAAFTERQMKGLRARTAQWER